MKKNNFLPILAGSILGAVYLIVNLCNGLYAYSIARDTYFSKAPVVENIKADKMTVSWDLYPEFDSSTHYQVQLNHALYGSSTQNNSIDLQNLAPGGTYETSVVTYHNGTVAGVSSPTTVLMAPASPLGITPYDIGSTSFRLIWTKVNSAIEYRIYEFPNKVLATTSGDINTAFVTGLTPGALISISVTALNSTGESYLSEQIPIQLLPPTPAISIKQGEIGNSWVNLYWNQIDGAKSYRIFINNELLTEVNAPVDHYRVENLATGTAVSVQMQVVNEGGASEVSEALIVQLVPTRPVLTVTAISSFSCTLQWSVSNGANFYKVYENRDWAIFNVPSTINSVVVTDHVTPGMTATYTVKAGNDSGETEHSNSVMVTFTSSTRGDIAFSPEEANFSMVAGLTPRRVAGKYRGKPLVVVQFPNDRSEAELALEGRYLEALASLPEMKKVNFLAVFSNKNISRGTKNIENLIWKRTTRATATIGKIPLVSFYNSEGWFVSYTKISMFIISPKEIYNGFPEVFEAGKKMIPLYHEVREKFEQVHQLKN